ncbi:MAG: hypothetical protein ABW110_03345 [Steroidobacteraceae bacterium]
MGTGSREEHASFLAHATGNRNTLELVMCQRVHRCREIIMRNLLAWLEDDAALLVGTEHLQPAAQLRAVDCESIDVADTLLCDSNPEFTRLIVAGIDCDGAHHANNCCDNFSKLQIHIR